jgi:cytochrome c-type biogenesis protein CcmE
MTRKRRRLMVLVVCGVCLGSATALVMSAFSGSLVFFLAPSDIATKAPVPGRNFRLGGLVETGSVQTVMKDGKPTVDFRITDGKTAVPVEYSGILPDLFREGQGVVTQGTLRHDGTFMASEVLAKHDATYMPKEVVDALKKSGHWNPDSGAPPPAAATWNTLAAQKKQGG